jgi:PAS domain S-box-containing protein
MRLKYAHSRGVLHRDLKGPNVILGDFGEVVVLDWGLAKLLDRPDGDANSPLIVLDQSDSCEVDLTQHGQAIGTPAYMAPEQAAGRLDQIDVCTDIYGLGAILYEILTGSPPFTGDSTEKILLNVRERMPAPPRRLWPEVPPALETLCLRALAKDPAARPSAGADLAHEVQGWQEGERRKAEEALRESEALYRSLVDVLPLILVRKDLESRFTFANNRACQSFGKPLEGILGKTDFDFFPADLAEYSQQTDHEVFESGKKIEIPPFLYIDKGQERYFQSIKTPVRDAGGKIIGVQIVIWDVTEQKRLQEALRESEALYHSLVENLPCVVFRKDLEGRLTFANHGFCDLLGRPVDELLGKTDFDVNPPDLAEKYRRDDQKVIESGGVFEDIEEHVSVQPQGKHYLHTLKTAVRDASGKIIGIQGICWDVTARKLAEEELRKSRELLQAIADNSTAVIYVKDADGRYILVSRWYETIFKVSREEIVGKKTDHELFSRELADQFRANDLKVLAAATPLEFEEYAPGEDGLHTYISIKFPIYDPAGNPYAIGGISTDITERKAAAEALRESEERYRSVMNALQEGIVLLDADGTICACNASAERILGMPANELVGQTSREPRIRTIREDGSLFLPDTYPTTITLRTGQPCCNVVMGVYRPDGVLTWISMNSQPLFRPSEPKPYAVLVSLSDITDRKRTEESLQHMTAELARSPTWSPCEPTPSNP